MAGARALAFLDRHLLSILLMCCTAYGGYATAQAGVRANYEDLNKRVEALEQRSNRRSPLLQCTIRSLDKLNDKVGVTPPCSMEGAD